MRQLVTFLTCFIITCNLHAAGSSIEANTETKMKGHIEKCLSEIIGFGHNDILEVADSVYVYETSERVNVAFSIGFHGVEFYGRSPEFRSILLCGFKSDNLNLKLEYINYKGKELIQDYDIELLNDPEAGETIAVGLFSITNRRFLLSGFKYKNNQKWPEFVPQNE